MRVKELLDNITELKKSTMSNYVQSATHDLAKQSEKAGRANANMDYKTGTEAEAKTEKRIKGINTAARKLAKEGYSANPAQQAAIAIAKKKKKEDDMVAKKMKKEDWRSELGYVEEAKSPAWQRKAGKNPSGGLNAKGVASYRAANPGSKLKTAVTTKPSKLKKGSKAANRRKSFCARMKGMKKRLTSAKTARDPDSRINKSLRKWNC